MPAASGVLYPNMPPLTAAQQALVDANLGLIGFTIKTYGRALIDERYDADDAWQDGYLGLCKAATKYDERRARLSTYAVGWIRAAISRGRGIATCRPDHRVVQQPRDASLNLPTTGGEGDVLGTVADLFASADDVETEAAKRMNDHADTALVATLLTFCRGDLEAAILHRPVTGESLATVGHRFGISGEAVRKREIRLHRRIRSAITWEDVA